MSLLNVRCLWLFTVSLGLLACADSAPVSDGLPAEISASELAERIAAGDTPIILDVRSAEEFAAGHVPGALHIPHTEISSRLGELNDTGGEVVVYCRSGRRAAIAQSVLREAGFSGVRDLTGHYLAWSDGDYPVAMP